MIWDFGPSSLGFGGFGSSGFGPSGVAAQVAPQVWPWDLDSVRGNPISRR